MREIKFRAWSEALKKMDYSPLNAVTFDGRVMFGNADITGFHSLLMQYTGLKDKNGKEIYEGDILEFTDKWEWYRSSYGVRMHFAVGEEHKKLKAMYDAEPMHRREVKFDPYEGYGLSRGDLENYFAVIGNIYENPNLLTV